MKGDDNAWQRKRGLRSCRRPHETPALPRADRGQFCLFENTSGGKTKTPIHVHARDDETIYLIEGELTAVIDGRPRRLTSGESIFLPRGIPHQLMNMSGSPCRYILIGTPALFDRFVEKSGREMQSGEVVGRPMPEEIERLREVSPRFGITLLPDWLPGHG